MSRGWTQSDVRVGEEVRITTDMLISGKSGMDNLIVTTVEAVNPTGVLLDCKFRPNYNAINPENSHYKMFISWASLYCGSIKLYRDDSTMIRAFREKGEVVNE